ncbi:MAG TPA: hypothetical protein EYG87_01140 [Methanothermococcus okinawensis]|uniref:Winged helix-turn-helix domain-containing protein n=1 Tax=Methanofervidicoccus abyssi TaxID=2082189 RepID=A0A401HRL9_9EURY|nr:winged helix-turn-helix domain-containing protein [Methanofervidicoccus abyssi]GBF36840.1 hypothetical protein MHHB_P1070 [Methanofervidicoccus abyssi]HIP16627.1 hypothetical protein [Methanothermococcus okinawensis]HIP34638.1 hypothetical protein [Methanothermococcus okinawensis]
MENMWPVIGKTAGRIYELLSKEGEKNITKIKEILRKEGYNDSIVVMAIGWLAREDNIEVLRDNKKWIIRLKR